jgi:hypothetical protein
MQQHRDELASLKEKKKIPFAFVLDELAELAPWTRPMFGCTAVYVGEKIVFALRHKAKKNDSYNGIWVATTREHHASLRRELPSLCSIAVLGEGETNWQMLPLNAPDFEQSALAACALVRAGDPRIGKIPKQKREKSRPKRRLRATGK